MGFFLWNKMQRSDTSEYTVGVSEDETEITKNFYIEKRVISF